jgi:hypothetical protein
MFSLRLSSIRLNDICLGISRFVFICAAFPLRRGYYALISAVHKDVDVVLLSAKGAYIKTDNNTTSTSL